MVDGISVDVAVIGGGPVGIFSVFACGQLGMKCCVIETLGELGGQCTALYPEKPIYDIPAYPKIYAGHLIDQLREQVDPFEPRYLTGHMAISAEEQDGCWIVRTDRGVSISAGAVFIAAGVGAFRPTRPELDDIDGYEGEGVRYFVSRLSDFAGKHVVIAGGGDSAVDWTLSIAPIAKSVSVVHRRDKFRAAPASVLQLKSLVESRTINLLVPYKIGSLIGDGRNISGIEVVSLEGSSQTIDADVLLACYGLTSSLGPIAEWGLAMDGSALLVDQSTMETSRRGMFAIGDIARYPSKLKLIMTGFSEATNAAHAAFKRMFPNKELRFEHSTTKGIPSKMEIAT